MPPTGDLKTVKRTLQNATAGVADTYESQFSDLPGLQSLFRAFERINEPETPYSMGKSREGLGLCEFNLITGIFGERGLGKTWLALWIVAQLFLNNQKVVYLNLDHNRPHKLLQRLIDTLKVPRDQVLRNLILLSPDTGNELHLAMARIKDNPPDLIVIDTLDVLASRTGKNPNDNGDMLELLGVVRSWVTGVKTAVLYLDHVSIKRGEGAAPRGAMGATHKGSHTDIYLRLTQGKAFARNVRGHLDIAYEKDREGGIGGFVKGGPGDVIGQWFFGGTDLEPDLTIPAEGLPTSDAQDALAAEMLKHPEFFDLDNNMKRKKFLRDKDIKFSSSDYAAAKCKATDMFYDTRGSTTGSIQKQQVQA